MSEYLAPCPFCGTTPRLKEMGDIVGIECGGDCDQTGLCVAFAPHKRESAIAAWNRRFHLRDRVATIVATLVDAKQPSGIEGQIRHVMQCVRDDIEAGYGDKQSHRTTLAEERLKVMIRLAIDNERKARDDGREALAREQQLRYARNALERIADGREQDAPKFAKVALAHVFGPTPTPMDASVMKRITTQLEPSTPAAECWCEKCRPNTIGYMRMIVCPDCGNKRCPRATSHENSCSGSNEVGQKGSSWEHVKPVGNNT